ncbi:MAG: multiheme c-type cytochrome [Bryobacteraceae bacterium]
MTSRSCAMLSFFLAATTPAVAADEPRSGFIGSAACAKCHPAEFAQQSKSGHAGSLSRFRDHVLAEKFLPLTANRKPPPEWAFGGGIQAVTFVSRLDDGSYLEHHLSYYGSTGRLALTPGHDGTTEPGVRYPLFSASGAILRCFACHSTGTPSVADGEIHPNEPGVRCETCHGPGAAHAKSPTLANIVRPGQYTPAQMNQACGSCHRKPAAKGDDTDFRNSWNARHQPLYLAQSKCFLNSANQLSCGNCHPPHGGPTRSACAGCHPGASHPAALKTTTRTCESCHMPPVKPTPELSFANHWIGVFAPGETLVPRIR